MNTRAYVILSGTIFGIVAALHLLRVVQGWPLTLGPWSAPMSASWVGAFVTAMLCLWSNRLASQSRI